LIVLWRIITIEDYIRVPPSRFDEPIEKVAYEQLRSTYEGKIERDVGIYVAILDVKVSRRGFIIFGDGATYHKVKFKALVYTPLSNEVVEGEIVGTTDFGAFVRIGAITGFIHKTQLMDENVVLYDKQSQTFIGERSRKKVGKGDTVRARIVSVSYVTRPTGEDIRVSMTTRQAFLGKIEWIEEELAALKKKLKTTPSR